jgi:hypothetical protein
MGKRKLKKYNKGFKLRAVKLCLETGQMILDGHQWSMKVTYSSYFGDPPEIDRIHTPYSWNVTLSKGGAVFKVAEGAAENALP